MYEHEGLKRWRGRTALITGASSGIGMAVAQALARQGMRLVLAARRTDRIEQLANALRNQAPEVLAVTTDVRSDDAIKALFATIRDRFGGLDVLVNNAGLGYRGTMADSDLSELREALDVNVLGLAVVQREALSAMDGREEAALINMASVVSHSVPHNRGITWYSATKHAVKAITDGLRAELVAAGRPIKVGMISPGMVNTEFHEKATRGQGKESMYGDYQPLDPEDVADAVLFMLATAPHVQVNDIVLRPVGQPH